MSKRLEDLPDCQAKRIVERFGSVNKMLEFMLRAGIRRTAQSVYHWIREGGFVPPNGIRDVMLAELQAQIKLTDADWSPYTAGQPRAMPLHQAVARFAPPKPRKEPVRAAPPPVSPEVTPEEQEASETTQERKRRMLL